MDGVTDICTKEEDINFVFTGFSVSGTVRCVQTLLCGSVSVSVFDTSIGLTNLLHLIQVLSKGHLLGPEGVEVKLSREGTEEKLQSIVTLPGGK